MVHLTKGHIIKKQKQTDDAHGPSTKEGHRRVSRKSRLGQPSGGTSFKEALLAMPNVGEDSDFERDPQLERPVEF